MKCVQDALASIMPDIPVIAGIWRTTTTNQNPPVQYVVYSTTTTENFAYDDEVQGYKTLVYMNLWSDIDPTATAKEIRRLMYAAGFGILEESDKGYNRPAYDPPTRQYTMQWTWVLYTDDFPE